MLQTGQTEGIQPGNDPVYHTWKAEPEKAFQTAILGLRTAELGFSAIDFMPGPNSTGPHRHECH